MGISENKQIILDFYEAGAQGDMDRCFALLADDITWTNIGTPYNNAYCQVIKIRGGKIAAVTEYMDTALIDSVFGNA